MTVLKLQPRRLWLQMRNDVLSNGRSLLITMAAAGAVIVGLSVLTSIGYIGNPNGGDGRAFHIPMYTLLLVVGGFVVTSLAFADLHDERKGMLYLSLPGSLLEKFVSKLLQTSVFWAIGATIVYFVGSLAGAGISQLAFGGSHGGYLPLSPGDLEIVWTYLLAQSIFLFGSIYFKKAAFIKTVLAVIVFAFAFAFVMVIAGRIVFASEFAHLIPTDAEMERLGQKLTDLTVEWPRVFEIIGNVVNFAVVPVFFWIAGFIRLRETEV
jgi:hypothetical protein